MRLEKYTSYMIFLYYAMVVGALEFKYHSNKEIEIVLRNFHNTSIRNIRTEMHSIGKTKNGNNLWVLMITASKPGMPGIPNVKLIGNMHGNEAAGREVLLQFIEYLRTNYTSDKEVAWLLNHTKIHIMPSMNPDGFEKANDVCNEQRGRANSLGVDLNRDFPDPFHKNLIRNASESIAMRKWMDETPFILSAALHGGALVANYPFDSLRVIWSDDRVVESPTPDNDVFRHLAMVYSQNHLTMHKSMDRHLGEKCNVIFKDGITNGAVWYSFEGGMGDYNYAKHGCMELTLEISCCKYPKANKLETLWLENKKALLKFSLEANKGIAGQIIDKLTKKPVGNAKLSIVGRNITFHSFKVTGEFWRLLLPGSYKLNIEAKGYHTQLVEFTVGNYSGSLPQLTFKKIFVYNATVFTTTTSTTVATTRTPSINKSKNNSHVLPKRHPAVVLTSSGDNFRTECMTLAAANMEILVQENSVVNEKLSNT
ncbi:hypothetical protein NQ315_010707 [Exocentrus adspersus]|uniref:Peptidase M14 domain-containing protein n=1 Tax=Exocentrus adspersus TaxID=1586481 RepID=A0AAV8VVW7_9CUCU|nr:hypothetical protein NQ315_010707 [Exocentrus adspersus]